MHYEWDVQGKSKKEWEFLTKNLEYGKKPKETLVLKNKIEIKSQFMCLTV